MTLETQAVTGHPLGVRTLTSSYDDDGLRTGLIYPSGKPLATTHTARGQLATVAFNAQNVATYTWRTNGQPLTTAYANGTQRTQAYDAANRLTGTGTSLGATTITGRGYTLDTMGRRTAYLDETAATAAFGYDAAGQVLSGTVPVPGGPASTSTYAYDQEGNRTTASSSIGASPMTTVTYTTNALNQYTAISTDPAPAYDPDGNQTTGTANPQFAISNLPLPITNVWDGENRLISSTPTAPNLGDRAVTNTYDAMSRRVKKTISEWTVSGWTVVETRHFTYKGWNPIEETITPAGDPTQLAENVWGADSSRSGRRAGGVGGLLQSTNASSTNYYHYDGNGNITALTDSTGAVTARYTYGPFGELLTATGPAAASNPFRFSTKYQDDETGMLYYGYRFYDCVKGRWINRDPINETGGVNLYGMVGNRVVYRFDLLGLVELQGPPNFTPICDMAKRLKKQIAKIPKGDFKLPFLNVQKCILDQLCKGKCCTTLSDAQWLNQVVERFMSPVFDMLNGKPDDRWKITIDQVQQYQNENNPAYDEEGEALGSIANPFGAFLGDWMNALLAARLMALTHVDQDLRAALLQAGVGTDKNWKCIGDQVSKCEKTEFNKFERMLSWLGGVISNSFDISEYRDDMRDQVESFLNPKDSQSGPDPYPSYVP